MNIDGGLYIVIVFFGPLDNMIPQGIDGSTRKPAHEHDTDYMVEKTYYAPPSRPEGPMHCPDRGNAGVH